MASLLILNNNILSVTAGVNSIKTRLNIPVNSLNSKSSPDLLKREKDPELGNCSSGSGSDDNPKSDDENEQGQHSDETERQDMLSPLPPNSNGRGDYHIAITHHQGHLHNNLPQGSQLDPVTAAKLLSLTPVKVHRFSESDSMLEEKFDPTSGGQRVHFGSFYLRFLNISK